MYLKFRNLFRVDCFTHSRHSRYRSCCELCPVPILIFESTRLIVPRRLKKLITTYLQVYQAMPRHFHLTIRFYLSELN